MTDTEGQATPVASRPVTAKRRAALAEILATLKHVPANCTLDGPHFHNMLGGRLVCTPGRFLN